MNNRYPGGLLVGILFILSLLVNTAYANSRQQTIDLPSGEEITFDVYGKNVPQRILWVGPNYGIQERHKQAASKLAKAGLQVWFVNITENLFMPGGAESMRKVPGGVIAELVEKLSGNGRYQVTIISSGYGGIPVLRGVHNWQNRSDKKARLTGVILFSPYFYTHVPTLGTAPTFVDIVGATNIPVYIFQEEKNGNRGHFPAMLETLQKNAPVYSEILKGTTFIFYEEDKAPETFAVLEQLPLKIKHAINYLGNHEIPDIAIKLPKKKQAITHSGLNVELTRYSGQVVPEPFTLKDKSGEMFTLDNLKGKVTLINFWATWCTPCIEEIPSLNRLKTRMQDKPFQLISINYAETPDRIKNFMKKVKVEFPVLLDSEGKVSRKWKVVAFPSTFVIGTDGKIHYGVNAAIHWDTDQVVLQLESLM